MNKGLWSKLLIIDNIFINLISKKNTNQEPNMSMAKDKSKKILLVFGPESIWKNNGTDINEAFFFIMTTKVYLPYQRKLSRSKF